jgi:ribonuclease HII
MSDLARCYPAYGFERHKGYGTPAHEEAIRRHGVSPHHRRSFAPIRAALEREAESQARTTVGNGPAVHAKTAAGRLLHMHNILED